MKCLRKEDGVTLIQVAIGLLIFGLLVQALFYGLGATQELEKNQITRARLSKIEKGIQIYIQKNGFAPCVAGRTHAVNTVDYGRELETAGARDCTRAAAPANEFVEVDDAGDIIQIGAVPVRTLNLSDDYMYDAWGRQFTYAVTENLTLSVNDYRNNDGVITVEDTDVVGGPDTISTSAMYVVFSHGPDGNGAFTRAGALAQACGAAVDGENCDEDDLLFRFDDPGDSFYSRTNTATRYDDFLEYGPKQPIFYSVVKDYDFEVMNCDVNHGGRNSNGFGDNCSTLSFAAVSHPPDKSPGESGVVRDYGVSLATHRTNDDYTIAGNIEGGFDDAGEISRIRDYGRPLYTSATRTASGIGKVMVRASIPVIYNQDLAGYVLEDTSITDPALLPADFRDLRIFNPDDTAANWQPQGNGASMGNGTRRWFEKEATGIDDPAAGREMKCNRIGWERAFQAAMYVRINGVLGADPIVIGDLVNPIAARDCHSSAYVMHTDMAGASGSFVGEFFVNTGDDYEVEIYLFTTQPWIANVSAWAGTIKHEEYSAEAYVEFMELGAFQ